MPPKIIETFIHVWPQWIACIIVTLLAIIFGMVVGWTSPYLAQLIGDTGLFQITHQEASWVASLMPFGRLFGAVVGAIALEYYGSKMALLLSGVPAIAGWVCIIVADSSSWLFVGRVCSGVGMGMFFSCFSLYVAEIATPNIRGALVSVIMNGMPFGTLIGHVLGPQVSMMSFGIIGLILNICYIVIFPFLPQTPHYYVYHDNIEKATKAIQRYHRKSDVTGELQEIVSFIQASKPTNLRERLKQISEKKNLLAFSIILLLFIFMQLSGLNTIIFYMEIIVRKAQVTSIEPENVVILASALGIIIGWISVYLIDRCGRRILTSVSCTFVVMAMALLALHFTLLDLNYDSKKLEWLPILAILLFMMLSIGLVPVPSTMLGELFSSNLKSIAGFLASVTAAFVSFVCSATYQPMVDAFTEKYVFGLYAVLMVIGLVFSIVYLPETKGKTLQEIQEMLEKQSQRGYRV